MKQQILEDLFAMQRFGIKPGLERTLELLDSCGNPHLKFKSIHIAGTNGKGTVSTCIASILSKNGLKVGLYTSPHLFDFNERIRINKEMISDDDLIELYKTLIQKAKAINATFFEITTVMAFLHFAKQNVDVAVIETGMGGRFDSTNVIQPLLSVITSIDIDHSEYLGDTIEKIAFEKAGIIKENTPVVISKQKNDALKVLKNEAKEKNTEISYWEDSIQILEIKEFTENFAYELKFTFNSASYIIITPLIGEHQISNQMTVFIAIQKLKQYFEFSDKSIKDGFLNVRSWGLRYRIEKLNRNGIKPDIIADTAHNPRAIEMLCDTLIDFYGTFEKFNVVFAAMADKDIEKMLEPLSYITRKLYVCDLQIPRAMKAKDIAEIAIDDVGFENVKTYKNPQLALKDCFKTKSNTIIVGSFYLLGEIGKENLDKLTTL